MKKGLTFGVLILAVAAGALALRLPRLDLRPMHIDEAIHAVRFNTLWRGEGFDYDPHDYHGPTLYYLTLPVVWLSGAAPSPAARRGDSPRCKSPTRQSRFGDGAQRGLGWTAATYRLVPVLAGVGLILLLGGIGDGLGRSAAAWAAILLAVSPAFGFYSRHYIMETPLVLFTFGAIVAGYRYVRTRRLAWAVLCGACLGLMHATKETCVLPWAAMAVASLVAWAWSRRRAGPDPAARRGDSPRCKSPTRQSRFGDGAQRGLGWAAMLVGLAAAVLVSVALFSVFFSNGHNVVESVGAWRHYADRAGGAGLHRQPWDYYLRMLLYWRLGDGPVWTEALILVLAAVGVVAALTGRGIGRPDERSLPLLRFLAVYTVVLTVAYSLIPYKTPWTMLGALHGMTLLAGVGAAAAVRLVPTAPVKAAAVVLLAAGAAHLAFQSYRANFVYPADGRNPYAYAQTLPDYRRLVRQVEPLAAVSPAGYDLRIDVITPPEDAWPLPWDLRRFRRVGYWPEVPPADRAPAPVIITSPRFMDELDRRVAATHVMIGYFELRPTVFLAAYVEDRLWEDYLVHIGRMERPGASTMEERPR